VNVVLLQRIRLAVNSTEVIYTMEPRTKRVWLELLDCLLVALIGKFYTYIRGNISNNF
jgi:hypothetical protein